MNIEQLSDVELREALIAQGHQCGPIMGTTRSVYQKKLAKLLEGQSGFVQVEEPPADVEEVQVAYIAPVESVPSPAKRNSSMTATRKTKESSVKPQEDGAVDDGHESDCDYRGEESFRIINTNGKELPQKKGASKLAMLFAFALIGAVFLFFLSDHVNRITGGSEDEL